MENLKKGNAKTRYVNWVILCLFYLLPSCDEDEVSEIYLEGEPIPGIEIFFPMGFYDAEPLMPKISPDGKKLLFSGPASLPEWKGLWVMDLESQTKTLLHPSGRYGDWAPTSDSVVFNIGSDIFKMSINDSEVIQITFDGGNFLADWGSKDFIVVNAPTCTTIINTSGEVIQCLEGAGGFPDCNLSFSNVIGVKGYSSTSIWKRITVYNLELNMIVDTLDAAINEDNRYPRISPDDKFITFRNDKGIFLMISNGDRLGKILPNHLYNSSHNNKIMLYSNTPSWHPDGKRIVYEHFLINRSNRVDDQLLVEGTISFYMVDADSAMALSNLD